MAELEVAEAEPEKSHGLDPEFSLIISTIYSSVHRTFSRI